MIVSASYRSDIPAFYSDWFRNRLSAGFVNVKNPYGGKLYRVSLAPSDVDGFVFWSRNVAPFMGVLDELKSQKQAFVVQFTITGYPRSIDVSTISVDLAIRQAKTLGALFGNKTIVWRYDPILVTDDMTLAWHAANFSRMAVLLNGVVDEVTVSFAHFYRKTVSNLRAGAQSEPIAWRDPSVQEKRSLLTRLATVAHEQGMQLSICTQPTLLIDGVSDAKCIDVQRLSYIANCEIRARQKGNRDGCACAESRDIGSYDTCPHGCRYCYAVRSPELAKTNYRSHDPLQDML